MRQGLFRKEMIQKLIIVFLCSLLIITELAITVDTLEINNPPFEGYTLFSPEYSSNTYLININGDVVHSWKSSYFGTLAAYLLENGDIIQTSIVPICPFVSGGYQGRVEILDWDGILVWKYEYCNSQHCSHHDIEVLPSGNILMIAWEYKSASEAISAGRNPSLLPRNELWLDHIIELEPTGYNSANIVWEWHVWDHLIQDFDPSKDNYGVVADHPELIDINYGDESDQPDFSHINSVDYNDEFDQILLSVKHFNEIWVIDHSTTTTEAAGHNGGRYGKGGDILYRWGNPNSYDAGSLSDQKLFFQHDAKWIELGSPGAGNILIFNNGLQRGYSSVDEIVPPVDSNGNYILVSGSAYGPQEPIWSYVADNPRDFFAYFLSGAQRLPNGNTLICNGPAGYFFEVTPGKEIVWEYKNRFPTPSFDDVFNIQRYSPDYPGLINKNFNPYIPSTPIGPNQLEKGESGTFSTNAADPNDDRVQYRFDWDAGGNHDNSSWTSLDVSGHIGSLSHSWDIPGIYRVKAQARDEHGSTSVWSDGLLVKVLSLNPPNSPDQPSGPIIGDTGISSVYSTSTIDPDGDNVKYGWDWDGDDIVDKWTDYYPSGITVSSYNVWSKPGIFNISVKAEDEFGSQSDFSLPLTVNVYMSNPDQHQENDEYCYYILDSEWQEFVPEKQKLLRVEVKIFRNLDLASPIELFIERPLGTVLTQLEIPSSSIPLDSQDWISFDVPDCNLIPGKNYYIRLASSGGHYSWCGIGDNSYPLGNSSKDVNWDWCFRTFAENESYPPNKPDTPYGSEIGKTGVEYEYKTTTIDVDGDNIYYLWDWDDDTPHELVGPNSSGESISAHHIWYEDGSYSIRVKAIDQNGLESEWSDPLSVSMPRNKPYTGRTLLRLLQDFLENHPLIYQLLQSLINF